MRPNIRQGSVDSVLTGIQYLEGSRGSKDLAAVLTTVSTIPEMTFTGDAHYHYLTDEYPIVGGI